ncbi:RlpA-like double-psi beta-barrel-protein domain-containing protein-containing protein [Earliella scabrosa]|nr:RlpA-like double-psi beta-barrel-protein domain-containing protein-containing protein [Earliella scabrosa]
MHFLTLASVALTAVAGASAISIPHNHVRHVKRIEKEKPDTYYEGYLEPYQTYHHRYLAIDCDEQHNTAFFDRCCHPMLATETLENNRDADCNPANRPSSVVASATSQILAPTSVSGDDDDEDCDDDDEPTHTVRTAAPTPTADDDDDDDDCEEEGDEPSSSAAPITIPEVPKTSSAAPVTTKAPSTTPAEPSTTPAEPSSTKAPTPSSSKPASTPSPTSGSGSSGNFKGGHATFYYQGGQAGACGKVNPDSAYIAALQTERYGNLGAKSSNCGRRIKLTNTNNGKSVEVVVADACPSCGDKNDLDLSVDAFKQIAKEEEGYVPIEWSFLD